MGVQHPWVTRNRTEGHLWGWIAALHIHPGICVGCEAQPSPQSDALVEKVSDAGHVSHSHPQEKPRAKVILEKKKKKAEFPLFLPGFRHAVVRSWRPGLAAGHQDMPPARRNPVPRAAAGSGQCRGRLWGRHCPSSPTFLPVKPPPHPGPALGPLPSLPAAFSRCGFSLPEASAAFR